uniref:dolichol kinase n=1 Tax=Timema monikensis TaxID=170555 RepID=A0A7R9E0G5_9NEOP|nr:unnamed protein product [Timema monikensis]
MVAQTIRKRAAMSACTLRQLVNVLVVLSSTAEDGEIEVRISVGPGADNGVWMGFLLPLAVLVDAFKYPTASHTNTKASIPVLSVGLLLGVVSTLISAIHPMQQTIGSSINLFTFMSSCLTAILMFEFTKTGLFICILMSFLIIFSSHQGLFVLLRSCPRSFTFGEACVVMQAFILFLYSSVANLYVEFSKEFPNDCVDTATVIIQVGLLGVALICATVYTFMSLRSPPAFYTTVFVVSAGFVIPFLHIILQSRNRLLYVCQIVLVVYWIVCSVVAILAVTTQVKAGEHASTRVRKYFHLLALAVFIPGILLRFCLLYLASGVVLALFVILEIMRVLHMPPLGSVLNEGFTAFVDEKDCGNLALTPLYLLVGCSLPLWLHPLGQWGPTLHLLSGLLAVGVGDTAASVVGSRYGHYNWPDSNKTIEGTLACIISQLVVVMVLGILGFMENSLGSFLKTTIAIVGTSLVEAKTDQVDNLALPLVTYILLVAQS